MANRGIEGLLQAFDSADKETLQRQVRKYDQLLDELGGEAGPPESPAEGGGGILALNGASGAGQSYVMERVALLLQESAIELPRIYLLGTRPPRPGEGHKNPYIFVREKEGGYQDIHHPDVIYGQDQIYYSYQSRPGAANAILLEDVREAQQRTMYLETVIPTLLHMKDNQIGAIPPWGEKLRIVYLAVPAGAEWLYRLLNREPAKLADQAYRASMVGRVESSIADMELAAEHRVPVVLNRHQQGERAAEEILAIWGL